MNVLTQRLDTSGSRICVGLDSRWDRIPDHEKKGQSVSQAIFSFNRQVIEATHDLTAVYKMNVAFYAGFGSDGLDGLAKTNAYLKKHYPDIPVLADCKRSEMGESVRMVEREIFGWLGFDAVMVTPWFGFDTVRDYLADPSHGVCVYIHDSNPTAAEFQDLVLSDGRKVYEAVAERVARTWNVNGNLFAEAGLTYPKELKRIREIIGEDMPILVAGYGPQGGKPEALRGLFGRGSRRLIVNSSRGIIFAGEGKKDYFGAVRQAASSLNALLSELSG